MAADTVLITGAGGNLGRALTAAALAQGHRVAAIDYGEPPAGPADRLLGLGGVDLADPAAAERAVRAAVERFGTADRLLNAVGGFVWRPTDAADAQTYAGMHRLNVLTVLNATRAALPHLLARPRAGIVNVGALAALQAGAGMGAYAAAKAGVHRLTEALAEETKASALTVNCVLPSILDTPQNRAEMGEAAAGGWVRPGDLAEVMLFLSGPGARAVTGALLPVRGRV